MEPYYYLILSLVLSVSLPLVFLFFRNRRSNLPPGRFGWPLIGESLAFHSAMQQGCTEKFFFERAAKCPGGADAAVFKTSLLGQATIVLCGAGGNRFVFGNEEKLVRQWLPPSLKRLFFASDDEDADPNKEAKDVRRLLPGLLKLEALRRNLGVMDTVAQRYFAAECSGGSFSVAGLAKRFTFRLAMSLLTSLDDPEEIKRLEANFATVESGIFAIPVNLPGTGLRRALNAMDVMREQVLQLVKRRKIELAEGTACKGQDVLTDMIICYSSEGHDYTDFEFAKWIIGLLLASHGSTSSACTSIIKYLAELPQIYEAVYNEQMTILKSKEGGEALNWDDLQKMKYSWNVAQEVMRLASPAPGTFREAIEDFTFGGFSVPKGWKVLLSTDATHKNPTYFPDPYKFDPARFEASDQFTPHTYVPFGGGPRVCPGREYAKVKILIFMHHLVKNCPWEKLAVN